MSFFVKWKQENGQLNAEPKRPAVYAPKTVEPIEGNLAKVRQPMPAVAPPPKPAEMAGSVHPAFVRPVATPVPAPDSEVREEPRRALSEKDIFSPKPRNPALNIEIEVATVTVLSDAISVKGELSGHQDIRVLGQFEGKIDFKHALVVGATGTVKADIVAKSVFIAGEIHGNITATDKIEIARTGKMFGDIRTPRLMMEDGATFKGRIDMNLEAAPRGVTPPPPKPPAKKAADLVKGEGAISLDALLQTDLEEAAKASKAAPQEKPVVVIKKDLKDLAPIKTPQPTAEEKAEPSKPGDAGLIVG